MSRRMFQNSEQDLVSMLIDQCDTNIQVLKSRLDAPSDPAVAAQRGNAPESQLLLPEASQESVAITANIESLVAIKKMLSEKKALLQSLSSTVIDVAGPVNQENDSVVSSKRNVGDVLNIALNLLKLSGPAFMVYAHKDEQPRANLLGPVFMNGIILSSVIGALLPYANTKAGLSHSTIAVLNTISGKLTEKVAPSLGMITSFLMLGQATMAATLNFAVITALIIFSLPAMLHIIAGQEMIKRFGPDPYGIAMKAIELSALSLFAFATAVGMKEDPYLKYQMAGVSVLLADTTVGIGKHIAKMIRAQHVEIQEPPVSSIN